MKGLYVEPKSIKLAGHGNSTQIGMAVGIAIDKYSGNTVVADDDLIKEAIRLELTNPNNNIPSFDEHTPSQIEAVDKMLKDVTNSMRAEDLRELF
ncbi:hypothetical protein AB6C83_08745 [Vibrio cyclitrophicus]